MLNNAGLFIRAVLDYLVFEIIELAGELAEAAKKNSIGLNDIKLALKCDSELCLFLSFFEYHEKYAKFDREAKARETETETEPEKESSEDEANSIQLNQKPLFQAKLKMAKKACSIKKCNQLT